MPKSDVKPKYFREPKLAENAKKTLITTCSLTDEEGSHIETPGEIFYRVVTHMAKATIRYLDEKKRRIVIPNEIAEVEDLHEGDYIEIDVKKIGKPSSVIDSK